MSFYLQPCTNSCVGKLEGCGPVLFQTGRGSLLVQRIDHFYLRSRNGSELIEMVQDSTDLR